MATPSTSSVLWAEWRRGLKDLQNAVLNPWNGVTQTHEESGSIGNPTPQLITQDIRGESVQQEDQNYQSMLESYAARGSEAQKQPEVEIER